MGNTNGGKYARIFFRLGIVRKKSGEKYKKAIERYVDLLKKEMKTGETKWIYKTKQRAVSRMKKYGIKSPEVEKILIKKGLQDLVSKISL